jgi:hypothetical protein
MAKKKTTPKKVDSMRHKDKRANLPTEELRDFVAGDSSNTAVAAKLLPVVICLSVSSGMIPASTTNCMLLKREPSFNSMNVIPLESRRERTQPRRVISLPTAKLNACLTETNCDAICAKYRNFWRAVNRQMLYFRNRGEVFDTGQGDGGDVIRAPGGTDAVGRGTAPGT